jgi:predicted glutamine amidotransferase
MCVLAVSKPNAVIEKKYFTHCAKFNRHGMGLAYVDPTTKKVVIVKDYLNVDDFHRKYMELIDKGANDHAMMIHFRFATAGGESLANCHPFPIKGGALAHNGTFFGRGAQMGGKSDSRIVAERMHNNLEYSLVNRNFKEFEKAFGYSRVGLLYDGGHYFIVNEGQGYWNDDTWYSNGGFRPRWEEYDSRRQNRYGKDDY